MKSVFKFIGLICLCLIFQACPTSDDDFNPDIEVNYVNNSEIEILNIRLGEAERGINLPINTPFGNSELIDALSTKASSKKLVRIESESISEIGFRIVFLSREVVETISWEEIRDNNMVLKVFDLTLEELEAMDFTLVYP